MSPLWFATSLLLPPAAAAAAGLLFRRREAPPPAVVALNAAMPGAGLAAAGRPLSEVGLGVLFAVVSLLTVGGVKDFVFWVPIMLVGGAWGVLYTPWNPLTQERSTARPVARRDANGRPPGSGSTAVAPRVARATGEQPATGEVEEETGYAVSLKCTECGAGLDLPVLQRMARCPFCGSDHLVVGHGDTLYLALPQRLQGADALREVILDYYRYRYYVQLYQRHVAPIERRALEVTPQGQLTSRSDLSAAAAAAEQAVSVRADAHRRKLKRKLRLGTSLNVLAPYRHGMGTLYQAAFGRTDKDQEKALRFAVASVEASVLAAEALDLPEMGKLSYLKALLPAAQYGQTARCLPLERGEDALTSAFGELDRKRLVRDMTVIRQGSVFTREVSAVVWRPWWLVEVWGAVPGETLLVDGAAGSVVGPAPFLNPAVLVPLPTEALASGVGLRFLPMECPTCGFEFTFDVNAVLHFCHNCHRVCAVEQGNKVNVEYDHAQTLTSEGSDQVPFWRFDLRLRTGDGSLVTDLLHLKDGIDGTLDQLGDGAPVEQHWFFVPAFRCINSRLMIRAFASLAQFTLQEPQRLASGRFPLDAKPRPWPVGLEEGEARQFAPLFLAHVFSRRDIARVNVHQVASGLLDARQESSGRLTYLNVPQAVTGSFRPYVGRFRARALAAADAGE